MAQKILKVEGPSKLLKKIAEKSDGNWKIKADNDMKTPEQP